MRSFYNIISLLFCCTLFACSHFESTDTGDLDGFWHMERIESMPSGDVTDLSSKRLFWAVQYKLINVRDADNVYGDFYLRFSREAGSLRLYSPYINSWHENEEGNGGDIPLDDATALYPYGIMSLDETFEVDRKSVV